MLFAFSTGEPCHEAEKAAHHLQTWLDTLSTEEYTLLTDELQAEPTAGDRPLIALLNAQIDSLRRHHSPPGTDAPWGLIVKKRLG